MITPWEYKLKRNVLMWKNPKLLRDKWTKKSVFIQRIKSDLKAGHSLVILFVGRTRLGKTWSAMSLASLLSDSFIVSPKRWVSFKEYGEDILNEIIKNGYEGLKDDIYILDECGKDLDFREYASKFNRIFSHILQTQQIANKVFILILPDAKLLAKAHHKLIDLIVWKRSRDVMEISKLASCPADLSGRQSYRYKIETILGFPLPHPNIIKWFETIEKPQKQDIAKALLKSLAEPEKKEKVFYKSIFDDE